MIIKQVSIVQASENRLDNLFDAKYGLAAVPNNTDIQYFGFTLYMKPYEFLDLAAPANTEKGKMWYVDKLEKGFKLGNPFLQVVDSKDYKDRPCWQVLSHEGRHRVAAIKHLYGSNCLIPVHIIPRNQRNRSLTPELLAMPFIPEKGAGVKTYLFSMHLVDLKSKNLFIGDKPQILEKQPVLA